MSILTQEIKEFVNTQKLGYVATTCPDGSPNLSPKGTVRAWDDHHLVFADIHSPNTISNLLHNSSIEINVVDIFTRKGYRFKGLAEVLSEGELFENILTYYRQGGAQHEHTIQHVVLVKVEHASPLLSPSYFTPMSVEEIKGQWVRYWDKVNGSEPDKR